MPATDTLNASLKRVYDYYLDSLTCEHTEVLVARDWRAINLSTAEVLRRIGSPVWIVARDPLSEFDDSPFVLVALDEPSGMVRFRPATVDDLPRACPASLFDGCGRPLED
jgi:hypothetical protein